MKPTGKPGGAGDDFFTIETLRAMARRLTAAEFERECPDPSLVFHTLDRDGPALQKDGDASTLEKSIKRTVDNDTSAGGGAAIMQDRCAFLKKRPGNPFPQMISIGRAMNNDIAINLETVSKLHGYFLKEGTSWSYSDHKSTNGTVINGQPVKSGEKRPLQDGDRFRIGLELGAVFLFPASLYHRVRGGRA